MTDFSWTYFFLAVNAALGLAAFKWAWYKTGRFRNPIPGLDEQFPELMRHDAPYWAKWRHYPGAVTLMLPRIVFSFSLVPVMAIILMIVLIGHDRNKPITGLRKVLCQGTIRVTIYLICLVMYFTFMSSERITLEQVNNYEEYLGPISEQKKYQSKDTQADPREPKRGKGPSSTIVCNHIGFMEIFNMLCVLTPSFTPKADVAKIPIINYITDAM